MRRNQLMTAGGVTLAGLGVLVGLAVGSQGAAPAIVARRSQPIEVRTEVIHKTVNVYRRAKPPHVAAAGPGGARSASGALYGASTAARTRTSPVHAATGAPVGTVVSTRTSGAKAVSGSPQSSGSGAVTTRSSGSAGGSSGSARPVSTRSSGGGGGDNGGGHDD